MKRSAIAILCLSIFVSFCGRISPDENYAPTPSRSVMLRATPTSPPVTTPTSAFSLPLTKPKAKNLYDELMADNGNCNLPCWWGIQPGSSEFFDAANLINSLRAIAVETTLTNDLAYGRFSEEVDGVYIYLNVTVYKQINSSKVLVILIDANASRAIGVGEYERVYDSPEYQKLLSRGLISQILMVFGIPDKVLLNVIFYSAEGPQVQTDMRLFFVNRGVFVSYENFDLSPRIADSISFCPNKAFITLWLLPDAGQREQSYEDILLGLPGGAWQDFLPTIQRNVMTLENATGSSLESFYSTYVENPDMCISTDAKIWSK